MKLLKVSDSTYEDIKRLNEGVYDGRVSESTVVDWLLIQLDEPIKDVGAPSEPLKDCELTTVSPHKHPDNPFLDCGEDAVFSTTTKSVSQDSDDE